MVVAGELPAQTRGDALRPPTSHRKSLDEKLAQDSNSSERRKL
jgi:hypothetical protein